MGMRRRTMNILITVVIAVVPLSLPLIVGVTLGTGPIFHAIPFTAVGILTATVLAGVVIRRGPVRWYLRERERIAAEDLLRESRFTSAWVLDSNDRREVTFVVPMDEPPSGTAEPRSMPDLVAALREIVPDRQVDLIPERDGLEKARLF